MYHWPSAKSLTGPRSTAWPFCPRNGGRTAKPSDGNGDDAADHGAEAERRGLEELAAREALPDSAARGCLDGARRQRCTVAGVGLAPLRLDGDVAARAAPAVAARAQTKPKTIVITSADRRDPRAG